MSERERNREKVAALGRRIKEHNDTKGGGMSSAVAAQKEAAQVARNADAQKEARALDNPNRGRASAERAERAAEARERAAGPKPGRIFIDLKKG